MKPYLKGWLLLRLSWGIVEGSVSILRLNSNWESKNGLGQLVAAAKLLQLCLTLSDPMDRSPPGSSIHWILQAKVLEWSAIAFSGDSWLGVGKHAVHKVEPLSRESIWLGESQGLWNLPSLEFLLLPLRGKPNERWDFLLLQGCGSGLFGYGKEGWLLKGGEPRGIFELYNLQ